MAEKRVINVVHQEGLKNLNNLLFVGVMMAVGVVLRLCAGFLAVAGMHPNFLIATYCLSLLIVRPKLHEAAIIGVISGCISQIGTSMPWINIMSETIGSVAMALLLMLPLPALLRPVVTTFLTTLVFWVLVYRDRSLHLRFSDVGSDLRTDGNGCSGNGGSQLCDRYDFEHSGQPGYE